MKTPKTIAARFVLGWVCAWTTSARAQQVLVPSPSTSGATSGWGAGPQAGPPGASELIPNALQSLLPSRWAPVALRPHLAYNFIYGTGLQSQPGSPQDTFIHQVAPGMLIDVGSHWTLDYTPTLTFYSANNFQNTLDHAVRLNGQNTYEDWTLGLAQNCTWTFDPEVETGQQTHREAFDTTLDAAYQINSLFSLELQAAQDLNYISGITNSVGSSMSWSTLDWLDYWWTPAISSGLGLGFGYTAVEQGNNMTFEQLRGRITCHVTRKIEFRTSGGAEIRQFLGSQVPDAISPVFEVDLDYYPFDFTSITLKASRSLSPSYFANQFTEATGFGATVNQRLLGRLNLAVGGGYTTTDYQATVAGQIVGRQDSYSYFTVSLGTSFLQRGSVSVSYSASRNNSNDGGFGYSSNQIGVQLAYRY
jgi:hypothetical protein